MEGIRRIAVSYNALLCINCLMNKVSEHVRILPCEVIALREMSLSSAAGSVTVSDVDPAWRLSYRLLRENGPFCYYWNHIPAAHVAKNLQVSSPEPRAGLAVHSAMSEPDSRFAASE